MHTGLLNVTRLESARPTKSLPHIRKKVHLLVRALCLGMVFLATNFAQGQNERPAKSRTPKPSARGAEILLPECSITAVDVAILSTDRSGVLADITVKEGAFVQTDQIVARLQDDVAQARFLLADAKAKDNVDIRYSAKAYDYAKKEYEIALDSRARVPGSVPELEAEKLKLAMDRGELQVEKAESDFELNKLSRDEALADLNSYRIKTPFPGMVTRVYKHKGEAVRQGDPVLELINTDRLRVEGYLSIRDRLRVKMGAAVAVRIDIPDEELEIEDDIFEGQITFIDVSVVGTSSICRVWAEVPNRDDLLRIGLPAQMMIDPDRILPAIEDRQSTAKDRKSELPPSRK
ncbi:MAG: efflux RND transporter periplasmic adaptor subunit [Planctomycetaceae bacterium]